MRLTLEHLSWILDPEVLTDGDLRSGVIGLYGEKIPRVNGRVALLFHGVACTWKFMRNLRKDLTIYDKIYLVAYDWRKPIEENADYVVKLIDRLDIETIDLHGYSMGGLICRKAGVNRVRHVFTYNTPHLGTHLAHLNKIIWLGTLFRSSLSSWRCDGIKDLIPGSSFLKSLTEPKIGSTYIAGTHGKKFLGGITQPLFIGQANDGLATVDSQISKGTNGIEQIIMPWDHFSIIGGYHGISLTNSLKFAGESQPWNVVLPIRKES